MSQIKTKKIERAIAEVNQKVNQGHFDDAISQLKGSYFGLYYPAMVNDNGIVTRIPSGVSQLETDLKITITNLKETNAIKVGWYKTKNDLYCLHCNHPDIGCVHCGKHYRTPDNNEHRLLDRAKALDTNLFEKDVLNYSNVLDKVSEDGLGLYVLHGHNEKYPFTTLPENVLSIIENGTTKFVLREEIEKKENFVPNMWRNIAGKCVPAGGFLV